MASASRERLENSAQYDRCVQRWCFTYPSDCALSSGAGARTDRHPVRSGQQAGGRNRNENPVAGRGPQPEAPQVTCHHAAPAKHWPTRHVRQLVTMRVTFARGYMRDGSQTGATVEV